VYLLVPLFLYLYLRPIVEEETNQEKKEFQESAAEYSRRKMGKARGVNSGGGESSLGYLFGSGESVPKPNKPNAKTGFTTTTTTTTTTDGAGGRPKTTTTTTTTGDKNKTEENSAGVRGSPNNYYRSDGQNCGNFLTERPSTKVHAAPGGGSSLGYLFGSGPCGSDK
jgi:SPIRAL1-like protein